MLTSLVKLRKLKLLIIFVILALVINLFLIQTSGFSQNKKNTNENLTISNVEIIGNKRVERELRPQTLANSGKN